MIVEDYTHQVNTINTRTHTEKYSTYKFGTIYAIASSFLRISLCVHLSHSLCPSVALSLAFVYSGFLSLAALLISVILNLAKAAYPFANNFQHIPDPYYTLAHCLAHTHELLLLLP